MEMRRGAAADVDEVAALYDALNDHLAAGEGIPGWRKGGYPAREDAELGASGGELYVAVEDGRIAGTVILKTGQDEVYRAIDWGTEIAESKVCTVHTLAVHPDFLRRGTGLFLVGFICSFAEERGLGAVRLDVYEHNTPAIRMYEKCGYRYVASTDLGYTASGTLYKLYQLLLPRPKTDGRLWGEK